MLLLLALIATTHGVFYKPNVPVNVEADYDWDLDAENDDMITLDNDIEDISNLVEQVNAIGEDWIWQNLPYIESDNVELVESSTTTPEATAPSVPTTDSDLPTTPDTTGTPGFKSIACFFGSFFPTGRSKPAPTPTIPPSKPVTSDATPRKVPTTEATIEDSAPTFLIKLCKNPHYKPPCVYVTESTPQLSELDDEISSIKVLEGTWVLYTGSNFTGERSWVRAGYSHPWLGVLKAEKGAQLELGNDDLSSLRLNPYSNTTEGLIMLCKNDRYNGPCINVTQDTPDLGVLNNEISAIKVIKGTWQLFSGEEYSGSKHWVSEGYEHPWLGVMQPDQGRTISLGDDKLSSLRAHGKHEN